MSRSIMRRSLAPPIEMVHKMLLFKRVKVSITRADSTTRPVSRCGTDEVRPTARAATNSVGLFHGCCPRLQKRGAAELEHHEWMVCALLACNLKRKGITGQVGTRNLSSGSRRSSRGAAKGTHPHPWCRIPLSSTVKPFQAIWTPMQMRMKAMMRRMPWIVVGATAALMRGAYA